MMYLIAFLFSFFMTFFGIVCVVNYRTNHKRILAADERSQAEKDAEYQAILAKYANPNAVVVREPIPHYTRPEIGHSWV